MDQWSLGEGSEDVWGERQVADMEEIRWLTTDNDGRPASNKGRCVSPVRRWMKNP